MSQFLFRRAALRGALAAAPALAAGATFALPAAISPSHPDAGLFALRGLIEAADHEFEDALNAMTPLENKHNAIKRSKPVGLVTDADFDKVLENFAKRMAEIRARDPSPEDLAYEEAMRKWEDDKARARVESGLAAAEAAENAASDVVIELKDRVVDTRAKTLAGLIFKAKYAAAHYPGEYDPEVADSIVDDLLAMSEDVPPA